MSGICGKPRRVRHPIPVAELHQHECYCCLASPELVNVLIRIRDIELCDVCIELTRAAALRYRTEADYERLTDFAP